MLLMPLLFPRRGESSPTLSSSAPCENHWMEFLGNKNNSRAFSSLTVTPYLSVSGHSALWESAASFNEIHPDSSVGYYSACERSECSEPAPLCCSVLWLYAQRINKVGEWTLKQIQNERSPLFCLYFFGCQDVDEQDFTSFRISLFTWAAHVDSFHLHLVM